MPKKNKEKNARNDEIPTTLTSETSIIHVAAKLGETQTLEAILSRLNGAPHHFFKKNKNGSTPLDLALEHQHTEAIIFFINLFIEAELAQEDLFEPLIKIPAEKWQSAVFAALVANNLTLNLTDYLGETYLHKAAQAGNLAILELLIASNQVDLQLLNQAGYSALDLAIQHGQTEAIAMLEQAESTAVTYSASTTDEDTEDENEQYTDNDQMQRKRKNHGTNEQATEQTSSKDKQSKEKPSPISSKKHKHSFLERHGLFNSNASNLVDGTKTAMVSHSSEI